jgi:transcriptional regulator with XRE-family HTH domain
VARDHDSTRPATESGGMTIRPATVWEDGGADVGSIVRMRRHAAGLTQQELADLAQVSLGTVRDLEQGRTHRPRRDSMIRLARALGLEATQLQTLTRSTPEPAGPEGARRPRDSGLQLNVLGPVEAWRDGARAGLGEPNSPVAGHGPACRLGRHRLAGQAAL